MKMYLNKFAISFFAGMFFFLGAFSVASAVTDPFSVDFESDCSGSALFCDTGMLPGDSAKSPSFTVTNNSNNSATLSIAFTGSGDLAKVIEVEVKEDDGGFDKSQTLKEWFDDGVIKLGDVSSKVSQQYNLSAKMLPHAGDAYQGGDVDFSICVGLSGGGMTCSGVVEDEKGSEEDPGSEHSTKEKIYTRGFGGSSGGTAFLRPVSPSLQLSNTPENPPRDQNPQDQNPQNLEGQNDAGNQLTEAGGDVGQNVQTDSELGNPTTRTEDENVKGSSDNKALENTAAAFFGIPDFLKDHLNCIVIFILFLIAIWLLTLLYDRKRKARELPEYPRRVHRFSFISTLLMLVFLLAILIPIPCIVLAYAILTLLSCTWTLYLHFKIQE